MAAKPVSFIPSPCIRVCTLDEDTGFCRGCLRTLMEITQWPNYTDEQKRGVLEELRERRALYGEGNAAC